MRSILAAVLLACLAGTAGAQTRYLPPIPPPTPTAPMTYGNWTVDGTLPGWVVIKTSNASGEVFGLLCSTERPDCSYYVGNVIGCENNTPYTAMVNAPSGAAVITLSCEWLGQQQYLEVDHKDDNSIISAIRDGAQVGFAFPAKDGGYHVSVFGMFGASTAMQEAANRYPRAVYQPSESSKPM